MANPLPIAALLGTASCLCSHADISLQFSSSSQQLTNISDSNGVTGQDGLLWGVLVDRAASGFDSVPVSVGVNLSDGSEIAPDFFFFNGGTTSTLPFGTDTGSPAAGTITTTGDIDPGVIPGITLDSSSGTPTGSSFALMWFDSGINSGDSLEAGDQYGLLTDNRFNLPTDGNFSEPYLFFGGADSVRAANLVVIPEPSTLALAGLGLLGFLRRRR